MTPARRSTLVAISIALAPLAGAARAVQPDSPAPPITLEALTNTPLGAPSPADLDWEAFGDRTVVLEFWGTWCGPCLAAIPHLNELADTLPGEEFAFLSVTFEETGVIEPFLERRRMNAWIGHDTDRDMVEAFDVQGWPTTFVVRNGRVVARTSPTQLSVERLREYAGGRVDRPRPGPMSRPRHRAISPGQDPFAWPPTEPVAQVIVRPAPEDGSSGAAWGGGRATLEGYATLAVVATLWDAAPAEVVFEGAGDAADLGVWDVVFNPPPGTDEAALQLVAASMGVRVERATRAVTVYELRLTGDAVTLPEGDALAAGSWTHRTERGRSVISAPGVTTEAIADLIGRLSIRSGAWLVEDATGVGREMIYALEDLSLALPATVASVNETLRAEAGLELVAVESERDVWVVTSAGE